MSDFVARNRLWTRLNTAVSQHPDRHSSPLAVVDLDSFDANAAALARRARRTASGASLVRGNKGQSGEAGPSHSPDAAGVGVPIRIASKSLRVPALIAGRGKATRDDANSFARAMAPVDIAYLDPPGRAIDPVDRCWGNSLLKPVQIGHRSQRILREQMQQIGQ